MSVPFNADGLCFQFCNLPHCSTQPCKTLDRMARDHSISKCPLAALTDLCSKHQSSKKQAHHVLVPNKALLTVKVQGAQVRSDPPQKMDLIGGEKKNGGKITSVNRFSCGWRQESHTYFTIKCYEKVLPVAEKVVEAFRKDGLGWPEPSTPWAQTLVHSQTACGCSS